MEGQSVLSFERIEGLSQSTGYSILKDRQGFIWVATADGLNRYDGIEMRSYRPGIGKAGGMMGRLIRSDILEDDQDRIWFSTDLAVHCFDKKTELFRTWPLSKEDTTRTNLFANPLLIKDGHLWLANADAGVFDLDLATGKNSFYQSSARLMYNGGVDSRNNFWFASNKGLFRFNIQSKRWERYFDEKDFYTVAVSNDTLFVSERKNVLIVPLTQNNLAFSLAEFSQEERDIIHRIYADASGNIWAGDESGNVFCRRVGSKDFQWSGNINLAGKVRTNYPVYSFYHDPSGRLWVGSYMLGLLKAEVQRQGFSVFPQSISGHIPESIFVNTFFENGDELWLGTFQKGIMVLDKKTGTTRTIELPYAGPPVVYGRSVHLIQSDSHGNLWTGSSGYLYVKRRGTDSFTPILIPPVPNVLQNAQVWSMAEYEDGWLVGTNVGVYRLTEHNKTFTMEHIGGLGIARVTGTWRATSGEWYIAFESGGIVITNDINSVNERKTVLNDTNIKAISYDSMHSILWVCSSDGLIAFDPPTARHKLLTDSYAYAVLPDSDDLWISTNAGLVHAALEFPADDDFPNATFVLFTTRDGLPDNQFNANAAHKGASGTFYFATPSGIVWFLPGDVKLNASAPKIVMTDITVNDERVASAGYVTQLSLPWSQNNLFFRFRGIEYSNPRKVRYSYQLKGWNKGWVDIGASNEVRYGNLPPGKYSLQVRTANGSSTWNDDLYSMDIIITPPFWRTGWFYTVVVIMFVAIVVVITRRNSYLSFQRKLAELERQQEIERERQRISREMHDEIGAGLTRITLISEFARNKGTTGIATELEEIADTSRHLVSNMGEIIWSLNPENGTLDQLFAYLREQLHRQLEYSGIDYSISFPDDDSVMMLSNEARRNIILATREIVNNSIRHSQAETLQVSAHLLPSGVKFEITDDGVGFDTNRIYQGNGLNNIRQRIAALGGELVISSSQGNGSRFVFTVRL